MGIQLAPGMRLPWRVLTKEPLKWNWSLVADRDRRHYYLVGGEEHREYWEEGREEDELLFPGRDAASRSWDWSHKGGSRDVSR